MIRFKAIWRATIFDIGYRLIKLNGGKVRKFAWGYYWWQGFEDRIGSEVAYLKHPGTNFKGWCGGKHWW